MRSEARSEELSGGESVRGTDIEWPTAAHGKFRDGYAALISSMIG